MLLFFVLLQLTLQNKTTKCGFLSFVTGGGVALGENMSAAKKAPTQWERGQSGNPKGRPKGTGRPISGLRRTLNKFRELSPEAMEIITQGLKEKEGSPVEKEESKSTPRALEIAKWIIQQELAYTRGAIAEETARGQTFPVEEEQSDSMPSTIPARPRIGKYKVGE